MKTISSISAVLVVSVLTACGQGGGGGRVNFNNVASENPIFVDNGGGPAVYAGSSYSIQLLWAVGTYTNQAAFDSANPSSSTPVAFFGVTGSPPAHSPDADGAGFFDGGTIRYMGPPSTNYTLQARGWFNGGQYSTYAAARTAGANTGLSVLFTANVPNIFTPAPDTIFPSFTMAASSPTSPLISIAIVGGNVQIDITALDATSPAEFTLQSATSPGGLFTDVVPPATITQTSPGHFQAVTPLSGTIQSYRVKR